MMDACEELAKQSSMDRVVLTVHLSNEAAGRFYAARGYVPDRTGAPGQISSMVAGQFMAWVLYIPDCLSSQTRVSVTPAPPSTTASSARHVARERQGLQLTSHSPSPAATRADSGRGRQVCLAFLLPGPMAPSAPPTPVPVPAFPASHRVRHDNRVFAAYVPFQICGQRRCHWIVEVCPPSVYASLSISSFQRLASCRQTLRGTTGATLASRARHTRTLRRLRRASGGCERCGWRGELSRGCS